MFKPTIDTDTNIINNQHFWQGMFNTFLDILNAQLI